MSFSDFHGDNEIRLSVSKIELTIKDWKNCDAKTLMLRQKLDPENGEYLDEKP